MLPENLELFFPPPTTSSPLPPRPPAVCGERLSRTGEKLARESWGFVEDEGLEEDVRDASCLASIRRLLGDPYILGAVPLPDLLLRLSPATPPFPPVPPRKED